MGGVGRRVGAVQGRLVAQLCTLSPPRPLPLFCFHFNCPIVLTFNSCFFFFFNFLSPSAQPFFLGYFFFLYLICLEKEDLFSSSQKYLILS